MKMTDSCRRIARYVAVVAAAIFAAAIFDGAAAQTWPSRPVRIMVGFPPGGPTDAVARLLAQRLGNSLNQQFVVENRAGAGGNIAAEVVARSAPDGYTLFLSSPGPLVTSQFLYKSLAFDPEKDFTPIIMVADMPILFAANNKVPVASLADLITYARANPGKLTYGSSGNGSIGHLAAELFKSLAKVDLVHVPYRGSQPALQDLVGGRIDLTVDNLAGAMGLVQGGQVKPLAITTAKRWPSLPNVPTVQDVGFPEYQASSWAHLFGPAKLPRDIVTVLNRDVGAYVASDEGTQRLLALGFLPVGGTPNDLANVLHADAARWGEVIRRVGIRLD